MSWWKNLRRTRPQPTAAAPPLFDEGFLRRLERLELVANRTLRGGLTGVHRSQRRLPAPTVSDHRPYTPGDDLRYLDWNAYARHEDLHIKMGEAEQDVRVHLVLDASASMDWGSGDSHKWTAARRLAAAIGYCALARSDALHLHVVQERPKPTTALRTSVPNDRRSFNGKQQSAAFLRQLEGLTTGGRGDLEATLTRLAQTQRPGLVVVISDLWQPTAALETALKHLSPPRWQPVVLHLLHPAEIKPVVDGDIELVDSETALTETLRVDAAVRGRYQRRLQDWCSAIEATCARRHANYILLSSDESLERAVLPYLRTRQVLQ